MAKPLRGECEVELAGKKYTLRLALGDLEELENLTGIGLIELGNRFANRAALARVTDAHRIIRQGFIGAKIKISEAELIRILEETGVRIIEAAALLLLSVIAGDDEGNAGAAEQQ